jgi:serine/threonine-protein kinase
MDDSERNALAAVESTLVAPRPPETDGAPVSLHGPGPRYAVRGLLGEGGAGRVERVFDEALLREVAAKQLKPELRGEPALLQQFLWEARVTAYLDHPNIIPVHDLARAPDGTLYFTMKLAAGNTLAAELEALAAGDRSVAERLPLPRRLRQFLQLCHAVSFAHARGVLHRDLKPANVMLGEHGEVLVTDWGLALPLPGPAGDALLHHLPDESTRGRSGTPLYMSPEQARGEALSARSDVYTLGAILYELVSLRRAVDAPGPREAMDKVARGEVRPLEGASPSLAAVIHRAMAFSPDERYPTVIALAADVETVLDGRTPDAEDASVVRQATRYYLGHDPAMGRLRVVDIDLWVLGGFLAGVGVALKVLPSFSSTWWAWIVAGGLAVVRPTLRFVNGRRRLRRSNS